MNNEEAGKLLNKVAADLFPRCFFSEARDMSKDKAAIAAKKAFELARVFLEVAQKENESHNDFPA
jgi:hypothetical protein